MRSALIRARDNAFAEEASCDLVRSKYLSRCDTQTLALRDIAGHSKMAGVV